MPKRTDLHKVLVIGSGPIVIGQACEFDYSGTQACRALREEGIYVVLANSNPATIMTDPQTADLTYIEPLTVEMLSALIARERPDALLPTVGGQTALNLALELHQQGVLQRYGVRLIGAGVEAIRKAESRESFQQAMRRIGLNVPQGSMVSSVAEAEAFAQHQGLPLIVRASFTLGGEGGGIAEDEQSLRRIVSDALIISPTHQALVEESVLGWKEFELEVMRDVRDNVVIICSIENLDPMGLHTGDSITVAPAQTLSDREYQQLRDMSARIIREIGVETGGSNIQFAVHPHDGRVYVIEMNPRVSRSSALASKATGFPIAKIAAKLALGYTLDELPNDITKRTPASFEPSLDYVVTKIPRFTFEKFPQAQIRLGMQMKSVGEVMAIGRVFQESLQKALRSLETGLSGLEPPADLPQEAAQRRAALAERLRYPTPERLQCLAELIRCGWSDAQLFAATQVDPWFLGQLREIVVCEAEIAATPWDALDAAALRAWKRRGFSDVRLGQLLGQSQQRVRDRRHALGVRPVYKKVDTCAAEFEAYTPYFYSTYEEEDEAPPLPGPKAVILGSGPNRIGQGIEFDYCCVHAALALREAGWKAVIVNCNPETVSTDYDISDRLYFDPVHEEDVLEILAHEQPDGVILQMGGQTPLKLSLALEQAGIRILGTPQESIDRTEDRRRCADLVHTLGLRQPAHGMANSIAQAQQIAERVGYPLIVRPSYVLGGQGMEIVRDAEDLSRLFHQAAQISLEHPVLVDQFLEGAQELDVDVLADGRQALVAGLMEHIELAGIHSGDSACSLPPHSLAEDLQLEIRRQATALALELGVIGLMNAQFAVREGKIYLLEVNPRASRTVPFVSKAVGLALPRLATHLMLGARLPQPLPPLRTLKYHAVKETVFPFARFPGADPLLGPEMLSTGEVMGRGSSFAEAFLKAQIAAHNGLPQGEWAFLSVADADKPLLPPLARRLQALGYRLLATSGTTQALRNDGLQDITQTHLCFGEPGSLFEHMHSGNLALVINTTRRSRRAIGPTHLRRMLLLHQIPYCTTLEAARALLEALSIFGRSPSFTYTPLLVADQETADGLELQHSPI